MTIVGTRPELIKLSMTLKELDKHTEHILVHTGQNYDYELNQVFFDDLQIRKPDHFLNCGQGHAIEAIADILCKTNELIEQHKPDACLLYGDTNSCLSAIAMKKSQIPIFHMEAGNRSFDQRVPEEVNRKIIDHLSDINMTLTEHSRNYLVQEGLSAQKIIKVGSSLPEVFRAYNSNIEQSQILSKLGLTEKKYFLVSCHRAENVDDENSLSALIQGLNQVAETYAFPLLFSVHPRTQNKLNQLNLKLHPLLQLSKPLGFFDYNQLQKKALCVLSDSGTITEESNILGFPAVTMRAIHERPEGTDVGAIIMSSTQPDSILQSVKATLELNHQPALIEDYQLNQEVSKVVVKTILSYTEFIRRTVYFKTTG